MLRANLEVLVVYPWGRPGRKWRPSDLISMKLLVANHEKTKWKTGDNTGENDNFWRSAAPFCNSQEGILRKPATMFFFAIHWSQVREGQSIMKPKPCWRKSFESKTYICDVFCQPRELSERSKVKIVTKQLFSSQKYLKSIGEIATITINTRSVNICEWVNRADHSH